MESIYQLLFQRLSAAFVSPVYKTRYFYSQLQVTTLASFVLACVVFISLWPVIDSMLLVAWFTLVCLICVARVMLHYFYQEKQPVDSELLPWNVLYIGSLFMASIFWGMIGFLFDPGWPMTQQVILLAVLAVLAVGAIVSYAVIPYLYYFFLCSLITPLFLSFLTSGSAIHQQNSLALVAYGLGLFLISRQFNRSLEHYTTQKEEHFTELLASQNELLRWKESKEEEDQVARALYTRISRIEPLDKPGIKGSVLPMGYFSGDFMYSAKTTEGEEYILMADFSGHGLPAALGAIPISSVFYGMTAKNHIPAAIVNELNRKLFQILPANHFCCACFMVLSADHSTIEIWNAGLPAVMILNDENEVIRHCYSNHVPLGIEKQNKDYLQFETVDLKNGDRVLAYSDGVIEAGSMTGNAFGMERLEATLKEAGKNTSYIDAIQSALNQHIPSHAREDDISILEIKAAITKSP